MERYEGCDCQENFRKYRDKAIPINEEMFITKRQLPPPEGSGLNSDVHGNS